MDEMIHSIYFTAKGFFGLEFSRKNTWQDWHLVPKTKPMIDPGKAKYTTLETPLFNGNIDTTNNLGSTVYRENCSGSWEFIMMNDFETIPMMSSILGFLHGHQMEVTLFDDPSRTYSGLITVDKVQSNSDYASLTINYSLYPIPTRT